MKLSLCLFISLLISKISKILESLLGKSNISISLWLISRHLILLFGTYFPISSFYLILCVGVCELDKTVISPHLHRLILCLKRPSQSIPVRFQVSLKPLCSSKLPFLVLSSPSNIYFSNSNQCPNIGKIEASPLNSSWKIGVP